MRFSATLLLSVIFCASVLVGAPSSADDPKVQLRAQVKKLVEQLGDPDATKQADAAAGLMKLGPDILPLLPTSDAEVTVNQKERLVPIRRTLREAQVQKELAPKLCTIHNAGIPFKTALEELTKQTGVAVRDGRRSTEENPLLKLDLEKVTFWQALDAISREADLKLNFYMKDAPIALADGPFQATPVSYSGIFRVAVKRVVVSRDLEGEEHSCQITLEVAWEPRFRPIFVDIQADGLTAQDGKGVALTVPDPGRGKTAVNRPAAVPFQMRVDAPARSMDRIGLLKGTLNATGPGRVLTFSFDDLAAVEKAKGGKELKAEQDGVVVQVRQFVVEPELWTVGFVLDYPPDSLEFESFESWLSTNEIYLQKKPDGQKVPANGGSEIDEQAGHRAATTYRFIDDEKVTLGKPADWRLIYKTPGTIIRVPVPFEFKDVPLP